MFLDEQVTCLPKALQQVLAFATTVGPALISLHSWNPKPSRRNAAELALLRKVSSMVNRSLDLPTILASSLEEVVSLLGMDAGAVRLLGRPGPNSAAGV